MANYPEFQVAPMRAELVQAGFTQLLTAEAVDLALQKPGTTLLVVNSVCGCAAAGARPGVIQALRGKGLRFDQLVTVFAGMEAEATQRARQYFEGAAPSSPQVAILKDGQLLHLMGRSAFLERSPQAIAEELAAAAAGVLATP
jgi:putative YphP/YqiW family bacilliredoxin